jgi:hypothetical protein
MSDVIGVPDKPGTYLVSCDEVVEWTEVKVYRERGLLKVDYPDVGRGWLVSDYHYNLDNCKWKLIGW